MCLCVGVGVCGGVWWDDLNILVSAFSLKLLQELQNYLILHEQIPMLIMPNATVSTPHTVIVLNHIHTGG